MFVGQVEAGGIKINCGEPETKGDPEWEIENEGEAAEKGAALHVKFKTWGTCSSEIAGLTRAVSGSECELETDQSEEEEKVPVTVASTCTFKTEGCELKLEPKENNERKWASVAYSGQEDENLSLEFEVTGLTTTVKGLACPAKTHEAKLVGAIDAQQVAPGGPPASEFRMVVPPNVVPYIMRVGRRVEVLLSNAQSVAVAGPGATRFTTAEPFVTPAAFAVASRTVAECAAFAFAANASCGMKVEYTRATYPTNVYINFEVARPGGGVESRLAVGALNL